MTSVFPAGFKGNRANIIMFIQIILPVAAVASGVNRNDGKQIRMPDTANPKGHMPDFSRHVPRGRCDDDRRLFSGGINPLGRFHAGRNRSFVLDARDGEARSGRQRRRGRPCE